ncbi:30S ribosomal protein S10 [Wolbachia endosymbiont of Pentidionis agamae]|uniref:30S ribosomal protein S10 n=1 Tax=Wolbachia endosymbiont of Pentidionis agamae TaxID=3110435 RepID=UPI002FD16B3D
MRQNIYIIIKAFDSKLLDNCIKKILHYLEQTTVKFSGPIMLPTKIMKFTVNRSPHVDKKSREQFEIRSPKRLIVLHNPVATVVKMLADLILPAGVKVVLKIKKGA